MASPSPPAATLVEQPPPLPLQVSISCDQPGPTTSSPLPLWTIDFGRPLQQANPLALFRVGGVYRWGRARLHAA